MTNEVRLSLICDPALLDDEERWWSFHHDAEFHALCYIVGELLARPFVTYR